jgi:hypothetical protein
MGGADAARRMREAVRGRCRITNPIHGHLMAIRFMKRQIDVQSEDDMKFFTPGLYLRFNSPDDQLADQADREWEATIHAYQKHLSDLRDQMPRQVRELCDLCLHDWEVVAWNDAVEPDPRPAGETLPVWSAFSVLSLRRESEIVSLNYVLWDRIQRSLAPSDWPFSRAQRYWMYDELDLASGRPGNYIHRVLFSDGTTAQIPFAIVFVHRIAWQPAEEDRRLPQSA